MSQTMIFVLLWVVGFAPNLEAAWYKGNTHTHPRTIVRGIPHGDSTANRVARWYADHGYDFIVLTAHNKVVEVEKLRVVKRRRDSFLVISGMEVTSDYRFPKLPKNGERSIHTTAVGIEHPVDWSFNTSMTPAEILQKHVEGISSQGGLSILNHPNYRWQLTVDDLKNARGWNLLEIYNAHPASKNFGKPGENRPSVEEMWDQLLSAGLRVYGVAVDDAHAFKSWKRKLRQHGIALPGGGWVMVQAEELTQAAILQNLRSGNFYASTGVHLKTVKPSRANYRVEVDEERTAAEIANWYVYEGAPRTSQPDSLNVDYISGPNYTRARVTLIKGGRVYYAWTQPAFD